MNKNDIKVTVFGVDVPFTFDGEVITILEDKQVGWEIVSYIDDFGDIYYNPSKDIVQKIIDMGGERIHSVKRLSDGEVFTVGDTIEGAQVDSYNIVTNYPSKIKSIRVINGTIGLSYGDVGEIIIAYAKKLHTPPQPSSIDRIEVSISEDVMNEQDFRAQSMANNSGVVVKSWEHFGWKYQINSGKTPINKDKFPLIKQAIEQAINGKEESEFKLPTRPQYGKGFPEELKLKYTQSEVDTIRRDTWKQCRMVRIIGNRPYPYKYPNFEDYLNSLSTPTTQPKEEDKPILFTTEDGVNLTKDNWKDEVWAIERGKYELMEQYNGKSLGTWLNGWYNTRWLPNPKENDERTIPLMKEHYLIFSTKESAEQYIIENKPCLSLKEIKEYVGIYASDFSLEMIEKLAKQKLTKQ